MRKQCLENPSSDIMKYLLYRNNLRKGVFER